MKTITVSLCVVFALIACVAAQGIQNVPVNSPMLGSIAQNGVVGQPINNVVNMGSFNSPYGSFYGGLSLYPFGGYPYYPTYQNYQNYYDPYSYGSYSPYNPYAYSSYYNPYYSPYYYQPASTGPITVVGNNAGGSVQAGNTAGGNILGNTFGSTVANANTNSNIVFMLW